MAALLVKSLLGKPVVVRVTSTGTLGEVADLRRMRGSRIRLRQLRAVDRWIALTRLMHDEISSLGIASEKIAIIPNSAEAPPVTCYDTAARHLARERLGLGQQEWLAVFSGRLSSEKGLDTLLDAWQQVQARAPHARLILLGSGGAFRSVETELHEQRRRLGLETSVDLRGHVDNVGEFLLACDAFVLPTRTEGMSNSLVEAMAAGAAIVTTDIPAHRGVVRNGEDALLVLPDDPRALAVAITRLFLDRQLARALGSAARERAIRDLGPERMTSAYLAVYAEALRER
jgi:glycosyltransferase involved in cell wall biosynthesis